MDVLNAIVSATKQVHDWADENKVQKISGKGLSTNDYTTEDKQAVSSIATDLTLLDGKLYLSKDGELLSSGVTLPSGGGGGGITSGSVTLVNQLPSTTITSALGSDVLLKFNYSSSEDETGSGTAYVYVGDVLKMTTKISPGNNIINISSCVGEGTSIIKLTCVDQYSNSKSLSYTTNIVSLKITSTFDDSQIYNGDINVRYVAYGAVKKDIVFVLDDTVYGTVTTSETGKQSTFTISKQDHGAHKLQIYATAEINGVQVKSNEILFDIMCIEDGITTPIITSAYNVTSIVQGELINIPFLVYDPSSLEAEVTIAIMQNGEVYSSVNRTVGRTKEIYSTRDVPVGNIEIVITYGVINKIHKLTIIKSDINISIKQTDMELQLKAAGRSNSDNNKDVWASGDITTGFEYFNWDSTGWVKDENGDTVLRCSGDSKATINFQPFASDARSTGRTIELSFAIRDVNNRDAVAISCLDGNVGFVVKADTAILSSEQTSVSCNYTDEEKINIAFVIEPRSMYRLVYIYLNGVMSGVKQYPETDNFQQHTAQCIEIGSPYCAVDLYSIRSYNTALTQDEIRDNYIADIIDVAERLAVYSDNDIYDIYGNLSFSKLQDKIPILVITGASLPSYKGDKKKVTVSFTHPEKPSLNYEDSATIDIQGTSSQFFRVKNWKIKTSQYHMIDTDKIETNVICTKADFAESTSSHNTAGANYVHTLYGDAKVPPQNDDDRVRTTIYGYPCLIFTRTDTNSTPEFMGKYNYNYDKSSYEAFAFTSSYPDAFSVEFCNNTSDACLFHGNVPDNWGDDFEYRYPDGHENIEDSGFNDMHSWVVSTYQDAATGDTLSSEYVGTDGTKYTTDTAEYRLAKFKKEFEQHFDMEFALIYYVWGLFGLYVDSFAKNLFLTSFDRKIWYPYYYDLDTSWAINNEGVVSYSPFLEDVDTVNGSRVFNGQLSTLWTNFRQAFPDKIQEKYRELRSLGLLTYEQIIEYFITRQTERFNESIFNEDSNYKYIDPIREENDASNLYQVRGTGNEHLRYFVKNRLMYCDSKWYAGDYPDDIVSLRIYTPSGDLVIPANANITITPYNDFYAGVRYKANGTLMQQRAKANEPVVFVAPSETFNDTETAVYGAGNISSLGDLSPLYCGTLNVSKATKLTELIVGNGISGYTNSNLTDLSIGTNNLLQKIDVRNCPNLIQPLALSNCPSIQEIYATGSGITGVELPPSGYLRIIHLPDTITNLTVTNQQYIEEFTLEGYDNLTTLRIEDAVNIPVEDIMLNAPNLNRVRLLDVSWEAESEDHLRQTIEKFKSCLGLDASGNNTSAAVVTGRVTVPSISDELFNDIYENFPDLVVDDGSGKPYIINYKDRDGKSLYVVRLAEGEDAYDPIEKGYIDMPPAIETENYKYFFVGWSTIPTNVNKHYIVTAQYRYAYPVRFYTDSDLLTLYYTQWVTGGENAIDPVANGDIEAPTKSGTDDKHYTFTSWSSLPTNITSTVEVYAIYTDTWAVRFYNDGVLVNTQWVLNSESAVNPITAGYIEAPTRVSTAQYDYTFSSWDGDYTNVTEARSITATYKSTIREYTIYFYNGETLVQTVENVQYGSSANYTGGALEKTGVDDPENYEFKGWNPSPVNIQGDMNCYAWFRFTAYLQDDWDTIAENVANGTATELYPIGGRKEIPFTLSDGTSYTADVEIIGYNHDDLADGSGKATLTFFSKDLCELQKSMNSSSTNIGGWEASEMRTFLNGELFNAFPDKLKAAIKPVYKISDGGCENKTLVTTTDSCWLASYNEVGFTDGKYNLSGQGDLYSSTFSSDKESRKKELSDGTGTGGWWLRSSYYSSNSSSMFLRVTTSGGSYGDIAFNPFYVAFGFCI